MKQGFSAPIVIIYSAENITGCDTDKGLNQADDSKNPASRNPAFAQPAVRLLTPAYIFAGHIYVTFQPG